MWNDPAWVQHGLDALRETLDLNDHEKREAVEFLLEHGFWDPTKLSYAAAVARWNANLNPAKPDFFKISEVWALMRKFRRYQLLEAMAADCGFELRPIPTEDRRQELLARIADALEANQRLVESAAAELQRLSEEGGDGKVVRIDPGVRAGGKFSAGGF